MKPRATLMRSSWAKQTAFGPDVLADAAAGRLQPRYASRNLPPFRDVRTDRSVLAGKRYLPVALVETTRGCPNSCSFCCVTTVFGGRFRHRPVDEVLAEVADCRERVVMFVDDNIVADVGAAKDLCRRLAPLGIKWVGQASLTMARDRELLTLMRESGCQGVLTGIESISSESLEQARKGWNKADLGYEEALDVVQDHGIAVVGSFALGMDGDTMESLDATLEFAVRTRLFAALFNLLTPYPGTDLYRDLAASGRLIRPRWWLDPDYRYGSAVFRPRHIDAEALAEVRQALYRDFYGARSTARRLLKGAANAHDPWRVLAYLAINLTAVRDERSRHDLALGGGSPGATYPGWPDLGEEHSCHDRS